MKTVGLASEYNVKFGGILPPSFPFLIILTPSSSLRNPQGVLILTRLA